MRWGAALVGALLLCLLSAQVSQAAPGKRESVVALIEEVNRSRIEEDIAHLVYKDPTKPYNNSRDNLRTRYARHPDCWDSAGSYIRQQLVELLGDSSLVEVSPFQRTPEDSVMYNIVGTLRGGGDGYFIFCAHYDATGRTTPDWDWRTDPAPGADDNGSGVAAVLETARVLGSSQGEFPFSVKFVFFSGEELGLWGSEHYAQEAAERRDNILGVINYDMIGQNEMPGLVLITNAQSEWLAGLLGETNNAYDIGLILDKRVDATANRSDHGPFWKVHYDGVFAIENYPPEYTNKAYDSIDDVISSDSLDYHLNFDLISRAARLQVAVYAQFAAFSSEYLPDLTVYPGDVRCSDDDDDNFLLTVRNFGGAPVESDFWVTVYDCAPDSSAFSTVSRQRVTEDISPGGCSIVLQVPWRRTVQTLFKIELDSDNEIAELGEENNTIYQAVRRIGIPELEISEDYVYPNPCSSGELCFHYQLSQPATVWIEVFSMLGERIWERQIPKGSDSDNDTRYGANQGINEVGWNCGNLSSGLYIYRISTFGGGGTGASDSVVGKFAVVK